PRGSPGDAAFRSRSGAQARISRPCPRRGRSHARRDGAQDRRAVRRGPRRAVSRRTSSARRVEIDSRRRGGPQTSERILPKRGRRRSLQLGFAGRSRAGEGLMQSANSRVASLDGLRAVSIGFVVLGHLAGTQGFPIVKATVPAALAALGVRVFFVISGFLITRLLLIEEQERGSIRLSTFYFRRAFRIFIPYYAFLASVALAAR